MLTITKSAIKPALIGACLLSSTMALAYERIVVLSGDVSDVLIALGVANKVVGKDDANTNAAVSHAKNVGVHRNLNAEPIVALKPDLVVGSHMVIPQSIFGRLNGLGIKAVNVAPNESVATYAKSIRTLGTLVGKVNQANTLASKWEAGMKPKPSTGKRYLLSYDGRVVAGKGTVGDELIRRAGGINAAANINGLKPLSREGWAAAKPDVIIVAKHNQATLGTVAQFKARTEIAGSPAAKNNKVYYWAANDFLRYGLDSPQVIINLNALAK